jgi:predicted RND superfamily exporter protein
VDLFVPVIVEDFGVADIGVLVLVLYFVSHVLIIRFLPLFCSLFSISV